MDTLQLMEDLKHLVETDISNTVKKGKIEPSEYCNLGEAVDIVKDIYEIYKLHYGMEESVYGNYDVNRGYSNTQSPNVHMDASYRQMRSPRTGRFISNMDEKESIKNDLNELLNTSQNDHERMLIMRIMGKME